MSARLPLIVANLAVAIAIGATYAPGVGGGRHHDIVYAALVLGALAMVPLWRHRRFTTLVLASAGAWSMLTGVLLVYLTWRLPHGRWMTLWHGATSVAFALAFVAHWVRNNPRLLGLARQLAGRRLALAAVTIAWLGLVALAVATSLPQARAEVTERAAQRWADVSLGATLALIVLTIAVGRSRWRPLTTKARNRVRGAVDASLLVAMWAATLTGLALLYLSRELRAADALWLTWAWHVVVSALLLGLALVHATFNVRPLASHAR